MKKVRMSRSQYTYCYKAKCSYCGKEFSGTCDDTSGELIYPDGHDCPGVEIIEKEEWIVHDLGTSELVCERCGTRKHMQYPMSHRLFQEISDEFVKIHEKCEPKKN